MNASKLRGIIFSEFSVFIYIPFVLKLNYLIINILIIETFLFVKFLIDNFETLKILEIYEG